MAFFIFPTVGMVTILDIILILILLYKTYIVQSSVLLVLLLLLLFLLLLLLQTNINFGQTNRMQSYVGWQKGNNRLE